MKFTDSLVVDDGVVYKGYMKDDIKYGPGVQVWPDNKKYEGEFKNNKFDGKGKIYHAAGDIY